MKQQPIAIISGASSGIGKELSFLLSKNNFHVILLSRKIISLKKNHAQITKYGGKANFFKCDVTSQKDIQKVKQKVEQMGDVEVIINNAGVGIFSKFEDINYNDWKLQLDVNLTGSFLVSQTFINNMKKRKTGTIIFINSVAGKYGFPYSAAYVASKFALRGFADSLRNEFREDNIRVASVYPGAVNTPFWKDKKLDFDSNKMLTSKEVSKVVLNIIQADNNTVYEDVVIRGIAGNL